ncbi:hypothetical protein ESP57_12280 [Agromyces fucosus]|uniref:AbiEi antitoxin C-terminal domain-containing protein n=1 Tax=Agromyces fucosus TaxID=41985 RepID=A0A4Q2JHB4_9MICO|nr:hypothetical protein [Agromyces fucosus]RXZ47351.1 hypothetical protein ESP57_12280 [Agromyces fucosus]
MPGARQDMRIALQRLAFSQAGYFSAAQALELGYSYQAQKYHVDHGNWLKVDRALFRLPGWPADSSDSYVRWSLWAAGRAVVSHETALAVHELSDESPSRVHLTVPRDFYARDDAVVLHADELSPADIESRGAWSVTSPMRTLLDVAGARASQEVVDRAVADALELRLLSRRQILRAADGAVDRAALRLERALAEAAS